MVSKKISRALISVFYKDNLDPIIKTLAAQGVEFVSTGGTQKFIEENWSLERFCLGPEFRNIYTQYLWGFPLQNFEFVGIVEKYQEDFAYFSREYLHTNIPLFQVNTAGAVGNKHTIDSDLRKKIELHHKEDIEIYQEFLKIRKTRL